MRNLTWNEVRARRLARGQLLERAPAERLVDVVSAVCGIHAQVMGAAELSIAARVDGVTQRDVRAALWERRELVKTWSLRGTLHLHPAAELPLWMAARRAATGYPDGPWHGPTVTSDEAHAAVEAIGEALRGRRLQREKLAEEVGTRLGSKAHELLSSGWGFLIADACLLGVACHGPPDGAKVSFVHVDDWLGPQREVEEGEALREVLRRYLATYGPARPQEFVAWISARHFRPPLARALFDSLGEELEQVEVEGRKAWLLAGEEAPSAAGGDSVRLLPQYDVYVMGFREREHFVTDAARTRLREHGRGRLEGPAAVPWLLVDGRVAGWWTRERRGKQIAIRVEPFVKLSRAQRGELDAEAERIGAFLGLAPDLTIVRT